MPSLAAMAPAAAQSSKSLDIAVSLSDLGSIKTSTDERRDVLARLLEEAPCVSAVWVAYFSFLREDSDARSDDVPLDLIVTAVNSAGADPMSAPLWVESIRLAAASMDPRATEVGLLLFRSAMQMPLAGSLAVWSLPEAHAWRTPELQKMRDASDVVLRREGQWPDALTPVSEEDDALAASLRLEWRSVLENMFLTLSTHAIADEVQLRRLDLAFSLMSQQLPWDDQVCCEFVLFRLHAMNTREGAMEVLESALARRQQAQKIPSLSRSLLLAALQHALASPDAAAAAPSATTATASELVANVTAALPDTDAKLMRQRWLARQLPSNSRNKKEFREIGKAWESARGVDWRVYHQWATLEQATTLDHRMISMIYERGLLCSERQDADFSALARSAERYFLSRHAEGELLRLCEKRVEVASSLGVLGLVEESWNRLMRYERALGIPWTGKTESRAAAATGKRDRYREQEALRFRVGTLTTLNEREMNVLWFLRDTAEMDEELTAELLEQRSIKRHRLEGPSPVPCEHIPEALSVLAPPVLSADADEVTMSEAVVSPTTEAEPERCTADLLHDEVQAHWLPWEAMPNPFPPNPQAPCDDVTGPRHLRGTAAHKLERDEVVEARITEEEFLRQQLREEAGGKQVGPTTNFPSQLAHLIEVLQESASSHHTAHQVRMMKRLSVRWLLSFLAPELNLGVALTNILRRKAAAAAAAAPTAASSSAGGNKSGGGGL